MAGARAWILQQLEAERGRWMLWLPVAMGLGIAVYFELPSEPAIWLGPALAAAASAAAFMAHTLEMCQEHPPYEVAAFFLCGREHLIPAMFRKIVEGVAASANVELDAFRYYLDRHIGLDEAEHGPASLRMMQALCGDHDRRWRVVQRAAEEALLARITLWDGIAEAIAAAQ